MANDHCTLSALRLGFRSFCFIYGAMLCFGLYLIFTPEDRYLAADGGIVTKDEYDRLPVHATGALILKPAEKPMFETKGVQGWAVVCLIGAYNLMKLYRELKKREAAAKDSEAREA